MKGIFQQTNKPALKSRIHSWNGFSGEILETIPILKVLQRFHENSNMNFSEWKSYFSLQRISFFLFGKVLLNLCRVSPNSPRWLFIQFRVEYRSKLACSKFNFIETSISSQYKIKQPSSQSQYEVRTTYYYRPWTTAVFQVTIPHFRWSSMCEREMSSSNDNVVGFLAREFTTKKTTEQNMKNCVTKPPPPPKKTSWEQFKAQENDTDPKREREQIWWQKHTRFFSWLQSNKRTRKNRCHLSDSCFAPSFCKQSLD